MVMQYVLIFARRYWPQLMLPVTIPVGCLGLWLESKFRSRDAVEAAPSIVSQREERRLTELERDGGEGGGGERQTARTQDRAADFDRSTSELREERRLNTLSSQSSPDSLAHHSPPHH